MALTMSNSEHKLLSLSDQLRTSQSQSECSTNKPDWVSKFRSVFNSVSSPTEQPQEGCDLSTYSSFRFLTQSPVADKNASASSEQFGKQLFSPHSKEIQERNDSAITSISDDQRPYFPILSPRVTHIRSVSALSAPAAFRPEPPSISNYMGTYFEAWASTSQLVDEDNESSSSSYVTAEYDTNSHHNRRLARLRRKLSNDSVLTRDSFVGTIDVHPIITDFHSVTYAPTMTISDSVSLKGRGWNLYTAYTLVIEPQNDYGHSNEEKYLIQRRYSSFRELYYGLKAKFPDVGESWPRFPSKAFLGRFDVGVIATRVEGFSNFLSFISRHDELYNSSEFHQFIQPDTTDINLRVDWVDKDKQSRRHSGLIERGGRVVFERDTRLLTP